MIDRKSKTLIEFMKNEPYWKCIKQIKKIERKMNPISKMRMILKASENMLTCIKEFYNKINVPFNNYVDADDVLSIFNYISAKSNITSLHTHCNLIERFATNNILNSVSGYYLTTI